MYIYAISTVYPYSSLHDYTDRWSANVCIVCRGGPVFILVGVSCAGCSQRGGRYFGFGFLHGLLP